MYVIDNPTKWKEYSHLVEFTSNNGHQTSTKLSPFEILYGQKCSTLIIWYNPVNRIMIGLELLKEIEE